MNEIDPLTSAPELDEGEVANDIDRLVDEYKALRAEAQRLWVEYHKIANPDFSMADWDAFGDGSEDRKHAYLLQEEVNERLVQFEQNYPDAVAEYERWEERQNKLLAKIRHSYDYELSDEEQ